MHNTLYPLLAVSQLLAVILLVFTGYWTGHMLGGFAWDGSNLQFNLHPLLMILGLVFFNGDAILIYRTFHKENKTVVKIMHMSMQIIAMICVIVSLKAVFSFHNASGIPNLYSAHSWIGFITVLLFFTQWIAGFISFFYPGLTEERRKTVLPFHRYFGLAIFSLACATSLAGINEKLFLILSTHYSERGSIAVVGNVLCLLIVAFALVVGFIATYPPYQRVPIQDSEKVPLTQAAGMSDFQSTGDDRVIEE